MAKGKGNITGPSQYSNARSEARKLNPGVNTTQRSWSDYEGDKPIKSKVGSSFYGDSEKYGIGGSKVDEFGGGNTTQRSWDNYVGPKKSKNQLGESKAEWDRMAGSGGSPSGGGISIGAGNSGSASGGGVSVNSEPSAPTPTPTPVNLLSPDAAGQMSLGGGSPSATSVTQPPKPEKPKEPTLSGPTTGLSMQQKRAAEIYRELRGRRK
jgi:hypothetical protein